MIYVFKIKTPANTAEADKQKTDLVLERGVTYRININFPPGPSELLHLQITDALHHVWPTNPDGSFASDSERINFEDEYPLLEPPYELYAYTWNLDDTYEHGVTIRIGIKPREGEEEQRIDDLYMRLPITYEI